MSLTKLNNSQSSFKNDNVKPLWLEHCQDINVENTVYKIYQTIDNLNLYLNQKNYEKINSCLLVLNQSPINIHHAMAVIRILNKSQYNLSCWSEFKNHVIQELTKRNLAINIVLSGVL